jgi:ribosomal protein S18 acetylase RimI-like enzyme
MPYLRKMALSDVNEVVSVHLSSFQGFFLTFLGARFLGLLYSYIACSSDGAGYVVVDEEDGIIGFVCGSTEPSGFYRRFFKKEWLHIVLATLWPVVRNPGIVPRLVWRVLRPPQASTDPGTATLMSIAVLPEHQNKGLGKVLVQEFLSEMQRRGIQRVNLTTDKEGNDAGNAFYHRLGFRLARSFVTPEGRWMNEYVITLCAGDANA